MNCDSDQGIWLEYGGVKSSGTIICCGVEAKRSRRKPLVIEKIPVQLIEDEKFRELDKFLQKEGDTNVKATLRGRFFAGEKVKYPSGDEIWSGFGHFGIHSLFAIEQVVSFEKNDRSRKRLVLSKLGFSGLQIDAYIIKSISRGSKCKEEYVIFHWSYSLKRYLLSYS